MERKAVRSCRHGGREVLRILMPQIVREEPLFAHVRAMCAILAEYAEQTLFPLAVTELEGAVANGRGYAFFPHRYEAFFSYEQKKSAIFATLTVRYTKGRAVCGCHTLPMTWSADGVWQTKKRGERHAFPSGDVIR